MTPMADSRPAEILLVEDNDSDALLTRETFRRSRLMLNLHRVENGEQCMAFLRREGSYAAAPAPDLILLDLNLPLMDGREVLAAMQADEKLRETAVAVLLSSEQERDMLDTYALPRATYMVKPIDCAQLQRVVKGIEGCWFTLVMQAATPAGG